MSAADTAVSYGIRLVRINEITGVPLSTLYDWYKSKPLLFEAVCRGAVEMSKNG